MAAPLRLIHVGVGGRGTWPVALIATQQQQAGPRFASAAFVDISEDALADAREVSGLGADACFGSLGEALEAVESDAVMIVTSPGSHTALCMEAVRAKKHLLVEKPFTKSLAEAVQIMDAADAAGVKVMVCQNDRFRSGADTLAALTAGGTLGQPYFGLMTRFGNRPSVKHSGEDEHAYLWERGIHDLDTICHMFGSRPSRIFCDSFNPPWSPYKGGSGVNAWIEFESGARCSLLLTFMDPLARPEDGGEGSRPTFGMAPGGGSTGGCRIDFEHGEPSSSPCPSLGPPPILAWLCCALHIRNERVAVWPAHWMCVRCARAQARRSSSARPTWTTWVGAGTSTAPAARAARRRSSTRRVRARASPRRC
jgi:predicted dehydrogenase